MKEFDTTHHVIIFLFVKTHSHWLQNLRQIFFYFVNLFCVCCDIKLPFAYEVCRREFDLRRHLVPPGKSWIQRAALGIFVCTWVGGWVRPNPP